MIRISQEQIYKFYHEYDEMKRLLKHRLNYADRIERKGQLDLYKHIEDLFNLKRDATD